MTDQRYSCQVCTRDDLTLIRNGRVRSHAANGKRVGPENPACGGGSDFPVQSTEFHTHRFEYGDDGHGHAGSVCTVDECGMVEPDDAEELNQALHEEKDRVPVPPNPFRAPLPGGLHDNAGVLREPGTAYTVTNPVTHDLEVAFEPYVPKSADDFLDNDENDDGEDAADGGSSYWPARYDGNCVSCGSHFLEGENIRRADGGYEAEDCCGDSAEPQEDRPRVVARTLPVVNGRYVLPHPETGKRTTGSRASKYAEGIADSFALDQWRHRMILIGLINDPEILDKVASGIRGLDPLEAVKIRRNFLNDRAEDAMQAAGYKKRAEKGTKLHKWTEEVDAGQRELEDVPKDYRPDATAYRLALAECGFRPVKGLIERSVYSDELGVSGTFDRVLECIRTTDVLDLDGRETTIHEGEFVIGDVKSGDNIESPWLEILIQEAIYAHAVNENGVAVQDEPGGPFRWADLAEFGVPSVREDVGVVMHVPYGSGECHFYAADLITGWRGAKICKDNRDFWKIKLPKVPIATFAVSDDAKVRAAEKERLEAEAAAIRKEQDDAMAALIDSAKDLGVLDDDRITCACGAKWDNIEAANAYDHDYDHCAPDEGPEQDGLATAAWEALFRSARTRDEANRAWLDARTAGLPKEEIKRLAGLVHLSDPKPQTPRSRPGSPPLTQPVQETVRKPEPPATPRDGASLTDRAHRVTTKEEASAVFKEASAKIKEMPEEKRPAAREYLTKLTKIMQDRLTPA
jgi:hypothetical protein